MSLSIPLFSLGFTHKSVRQEEGYLLIKFAGEGVGRRKNMNLTWKLSHDIVIVSCFDYHGRVLSEMLLAVCVFLFSL